MWRNPFGFTKGSIALPGPEGSRGSPLPGEDGNLSVHPLRTARRGAAAICNSSPSNAGLLRGPARALASVLLTTCQDYESLTEPAPFQPSGSDNHVASDRTPAGPPGRDREPPHSETQGGETALSAPSLGRAPAALRVSALRVHARREPPRSRPELGAPP